MSVNGVTGVAAATYASSATGTAKTATAAEKNTTAADTGVVYEPSTDATDSKSNKMTSYPA